MRESSFLRTEALTLALKLHAAQIGAETVRCEVSAPPSEVLGSLELPKKNKAGPLGPAH